jgi:hypothetical protein
VRTTCRSAATVPDRRALPRRFAIAALIAALPLAACTTTPTGEPVAIDRRQGSEENISSLTATIERDPRNAEHYNVRGSAFGRAGKYDDAPPMPIAP